MPGIEWERQGKTWLLGGYKPGQDGCSTGHMWSDNLREFGSNPSLLIHRMSTCGDLDASTILICEQHIICRNSHPWGIMGKTDRTDLYTLQPLELSPTSMVCGSLGKNILRAGFLANYDKDRLHALPASVLLCSAKSLKPTTLGSEPRAVSVFPGQLTKDNASQSYSIPWGENTINKFVVRADVWGWQFWDPILKPGQILERKPAISMGRKGMKIKEI